MRRLLGSLLTVAAGFVLTVTAWAVLSLWSDRHPLPAPPPSDPTTGLSELLNPPKEAPMLPSPPCTLAEIKLRLHGCPVILR